MESTNLREGPLDTRLSEDLDVQMFESESISEEDYEEYTTISEDRASVSSEERDEEDSS